jgi:hypothetical protein
LGRVTGVDRTYWEVDPTTPAVSDFHRACEAAAGFVAELLYDRENYRRAASIEEMLTGQTIAEIISQKTNLDAPDIWTKVLDETGKNLRENEGVIREIMARFEHGDVVHESQLAPLVARVKGCSPGVLANACATH